MSDYRSLTLRSAATERLVELVNRWDDADLDAIAMALTSIRIHAKPVPDGMRLKVVLCDCDGFEFINRIVFDKRGSDERKV